MTARKPKPRPRKASGPTLEQRVAELEEIINAIVEPTLTACCEHLDALESRSKFRDASHDAPVSNGSEAIGQLRAQFERAYAGPPSLWRRFLTFMGAP